MWRRHQTSIIIALAFIFMFSAFWLFPSLSFIIFIALLWNLLLIKPAEYLRRRTKLSSGVSAAIVLTAFIIIVGGFFTIISRTLIPSLQEFIYDLPNISSRIKSIPFIAHSPFWTGEFNSLWSDIASVSVDALKSSLTLILSVFSKFIDFIIIIFATFYLLGDGQQIKHWIAGLFPHPDQHRITSLINSIMYSLRIYVCSQLTICIITAAVVFAGFEFFHLPYASVFAVLSGISEFVPVIGPTLASCFGILLAATFSVEIAVRIAIFYFIQTQITHNIIYPYIVGKDLHLHPLAILLGVMLGGELLGPLGMFLAVPCMVILRLVIVNIVKDLSSPEKNPPVE